MQSTLRTLFALAVLNGLVACDNDGSDFTTGRPFANPPELSSVDGILDPTLTVAPARLTVAGETV